MFVLEVYLLDSDAPIAFERATREARDELVAAFFERRPPPPILVARRTDDATATDNAEVSIVRAYVGHFVCREG